MTGEAFRRWLKAMKISGAQAAELLGVHKNTVTRFKRDGTDRAIALACAALWHRLGPWS